MKMLAIILFCIFGLTSCQKYSISDTLFIASIGIEKEEDMYCGYFYLPLSSDIGKTENTQNKGKGDYAKVKGKSIAELFQNVKVTIALNMNFKHVSSLVLNQELLNQKFLEELSDFIKYSLDIDFNIYVFATKEKMSDVYDFQNPNQEGVLNSLLVSTSDAKMTYLVTEPVHFLEFIRKFHSERSIILPLLDLEELWTIDGKPVKNSYCQSAVYYYKGMVKEAIRKPGSPYIKSVKQFEDIIDGNSITFQNYKMKIQYKDQLKLNCCFSYEMLCSNTNITRKDIQEFVIKRVKEYIDEFKEIDPFDIAYFNSIKKKNMSYDQVGIQVSIKMN